MDCMDDLFSQIEADQVPSGIATIQVAISQDVRIPALSFQYLGLRCWLEIIRGNRGDKKLTLPAQAD